MHLFHFSWGEFKHKLKALQPSYDKLIRRITMVELLLGNEKLEDDEKTVREAGISTDAWTS